MLEEFKDSFLWCILTEDCIDRDIWISFFIAIFALNIFGYIARWIKEPVEKIYQHLYEVKIEMEKEKREKS